MSISCVYLITFDGCNKCYVGSTKDFKRRSQCHKATLKMGTGSKRLQNAYNKYGPDVMHFEIVDECCEGDLIAFEQFWINTFGAYSKEYGLNGRPVAEKCFSVKHTEESKAKLREKATGRKHTEATKELLRQVTSAKTSETRAKMVLAWQSRVVSDEVRSKSSALLSERMKGVPKKEAHKEKLKHHLAGLALNRRKIITFDGVTMSVQDWADLLGMKANTLRKRLQTWTLEKALQPRTYKCNK